jgi:hypothetical protein
MTPHSPSHGAREELSSDLRIDFVQGKPTAAFFHIFNGHENADACATKINCTFYALPQ